MKRSTRQKISLLLCSASFFATSTLLAYEGTDTISNADIQYAQVIKEAEEDNSGGYFKVGYGYKYATSPYEDEVNKASLFVSGRYQFSNGIFLESHFGAKELNQGSTLGYNFYNNEHWSFDVNLLQGHGEINITFFFDDATNPETGTSRFDMDREQTTMLGLRATGSYENRYGQTTFQTNVAPVSFNGDFDDGFYANAWASHSWQIKNWEFYASAGLTYRNDNMLDYYYEIPEAVKEVNFNLPAYNPDGGVDVSVQTGFSYPLTQDLLFESYYRYTNVSDSISDSPLMNYFGNIPDRSENISEFAMLVSYVF
jgi:outer membrane protein